MIDYVPRAWAPAVYALDGLDSSEEETIVVDLQNCCSVRIDL